MAGSYHHFSAEAESTCFPAAIPVPPCTGPYALSLGPSSLWGDDIIGLGFLPSVGMKRGLF